MDKIDFVALEKELYLPATKPEVVEVPAMQYIMFDGKGLPEGGPEFQQAFSALYGVAYTIKFMGKKKLGRKPAGWVDFKVPPPEGLWWMEDGQSFDMERSHDWRWTLMIRMPAFVTKELVAKVVSELVKKKQSDVYKKIRLEPLKEGLSVQMTHIGPYESEEADIASMETFAKEHGYRLTGKHHEIYFGDPRRTRPEKLKTVLRHPVAV